MPTGRLVKHSSGAEPFSGAVRLPITVEVRQWQRCFVEGLEVE